MVKVHLQGGRRCDECNRWFPTKYNYGRHVQAKHALGRPCKMANCLKQTKGKAENRLHLVRTHMYNHTCPLCFIVMSNWPELSNHLLISHWQDKSSRLNQWLMDKYQKTHASRALLLNADVDPILETLDGHQYKCTEADTVGGVAEWWECRQEGCHVRYFTFRNRPFGRAISSAFPTDVHDHLPLGQNQFPKTQPEVTDENERGQVLQYSYMSNLYNYQRQVVFAQIMYDEYGCVLPSCKCQIYKQHNQLSFYILSNNNYHTVHPTMNTFDRAVGKPVPPAYRTRQQQAQQHVINTPSLNTSFTSQSSVVSELYGGHSEKLYEKLGTALRENPRLRHKDSMALFHNYLKYLESKIGVMSGWDLFRMVTRPARRLLPADPEDLCWSPIFPLQKTLRFNHDLGTLQVGGRNNWINLCLRQPECYMPALTLGWCKKHEPGAKMFVGLYLDKGNNDETILWPVLWVISRAEQDDYHGHHPSLAFIMQKWRASANKLVISYKRERAAVDKQVDFEKIVGLVLEGSYMFRKASEIFATMTTALSLVTRSYMMRRASLPTKHQKGLRFLAPAAIPCRYERESVNEILRLNKVGFEMLPLARLEELCLDGSVEQKAYAVTRLKEFKNKLAKAKMGQEMDNTALFLPAEAESKDCASVYAQDYDGHVYVGLRSSAVHCKGESVYHQGYNLGGPAHLENQLGIRMVDVTLFSCLKNNTVEDNNSDEALSQLTVMLANLCDVTGPFQLRLESSPAKLANFLWTNGHIRDADLGKLYTFALAIVDCELSWFCELDLGVEGLRLPECYYHDNVIQVNGVDEVINPLEELLLDDEIFSDEE